MQSVSSNAVAQALKLYSPKFKTEHISGTTSSNGYVETLIPLNSKFIVSATCTDNLGFAVTPVRVADKWWFYIYGTNNGITTPRSSTYVEVEYYYYDL